MKLFILLFISLISLFSQSPNPTGQAVAVNEAPLAELWTVPIYVSGNDTYLCYAKQVSNQSTIIQSAISNASSAVITATGHGIHSKQSPLVTISGGTGNWAALNGTWKATYVDANSFSVAVNSTSFGAVTGTVVITTRAPLLTSPIWGVYKSSTDGTNPVMNIWAAGGYSNKCSDYATLAYQ